MPLPTLKFLPHAALLLGLCAPVWLTTTGPVTASDYEEETENNSPALDVQVEQAHDFQRLGRESARSGRLIVLEISTSHCGYCELLEDQYLRPMLRSGDYNHILLRKLNTDTPIPVIAFDGRTMDGEDFAWQYRAGVTPTLLFLDAHGKEVAPRIIGFNTPELFGGYLDAAIEAGLSTIERAAR